MFKKMFQIVIALAVLLHSTSANYNVQPQYQVSIMLEFHPGNPIHLCNGAIIYEKLIITTANCVHFKFNPKEKPSKLDPSVINVLAGSTNAFTDALRVNVSSIEIAENFDPETLENDLALLTLSQSLPLGTRPDMKWIMLDDNIHVNHSCLANFFSRSSKDAIPNYYQTEELTLYNNEICRNATKHPNARKEDICSIYILPQQFNCAAAESFLSFNNDRGTGLVCKSYLVGLLSSVVTRPDPKNNCTDIELAAMYTNIFPHLMWVYTIMANIETEYISTPYDASLKSLVVKSPNNNGDEVLTTTLSPVNVTNFSNSTTTLNSTVINPTTLNSTTTNSTTWNPTVTNSTVGNSTRTNSTTANPVQGNSTTTAVNATFVSFTVVNSTDVNPSWNPVPLNTTTWNSTAVNSTSTNTTTPAPLTTQTILRPSPTTKPAYTSSTDSYINLPMPTVRNFLKNSSSSARFSALSLLIALITLKLIITH